MIKTGTSRIQTTDDQVIVELWSGDRKLTIYIDSAVEVIQVPPSGEVITSNDVVASLRWLATGD